MAKAKQKATKPKKPVRWQKFDISVSLPLYSKIKDERYIEGLDRLSIIEQALDIVGAEYAIATYSTNEEY